MSDESDTELDLVKFLSTNSDTETDSDSDIDEKIHRPTNINTQKCNEIIQMQIKNRLSHKATSDVTELINSMPNISIKIPKYPIKFVAKDIDFNIFFYCDSCDEIVLEHNKCSGCERFFKKESKKNNFFVYISLEQQIRRLLNKHFPEIINYLKREHDNNVLCDIDDGTLFKKIAAKNPSVHILGFTINTDGANIYKSSNGSLWPVQLYANFLPPNIRYASENVIVSTLYYGNKKPDMSTLLYTLATEFDQLKEKLIIIYKENEIWSFRPTVILGVFDLPARAEVQSMKGPTGKFSCPFCLHPGDPIKNLSGRTTIRYIHKSTQPKIRTHSDTVLISQRIQTLRKTTLIDSIDGIKSNSCLFMFDEIDLINSLPVDVMHGIYLGIMKDMIEIWIGKKRIPTPPYKEYKIKSVKFRQLLSQRILSLKPNIHFSRKPRSIFEIANFKASELMNLMLYYLRYSLVGILPTKIIKNFEKISAATYICNKKQVSKDELHVAKGLFIEFAREYEEIYGKGAITMNVHLLNHYHSIILQCGPVWSYNMFGFENNIGKLKNFVCGPTDVLSQIANKYVASLNMESIDDLKHETVEKDSVYLYQQSNTILKQEYAYLFQNIGYNETSLQIWRRIRKSGIIYTSTSALSTKSIDYFVKMTNSQIGKIQFFFGDQQKPKLLLHCFENLHQNFQWTEIRESNLYEIFDCDEIYEKLLYFVSGSIQFITKEPNTFGRGKSNIILEKILDSSIEKLIYLIVYSINYFYIYFIIHSGLIDFSTRWRLSALSIPFVLQKVLLKMSKRSLCIYMCTVYTVHSLMHCAERQLRNSNHSSYLDSRTDNITFNIATQFITSNIHHIFPAKIIFRTSRKWVRNE